MSVQADPPRPAFSVPPELEADMDAAIARYPVSRRSAVLPLLHLTQAHFGYLPPESSAWIARKLGIEPIHVLELVTFYPMFRQEPVGRFHIRVCRTLSCMLAGSDRLMRALRDATGIDPAEIDPQHAFAVSPDGLYSIEFVECLACCDRAPALMVDDALLERVDPADIPAILARLAADAPPPR